ncbi:cytochrome-c peroxidase [Tenacibaculum finnmarkense]|uniref:cytochrome-c peroxidase n=1 Tax=Tenacibaculum finnmarkense TaxID=2781243 RepID=UPI001EFB84C6|nr:cytochrome c peroxidase [Tenacibaculum finnmarkense]MCG8858596.1 methylamine utilization protein [Tenacibaculum finnmarkense]
MKDLLGQAKTYLCVCLLLLVVACNQKSEKYSSITEFSDTVKKLYLSHLSKAIENLDSMEFKSTKAQQKHYILARKYFKLSEPILAFSDKDNYKSLNAPNIIGVHGEASNDTRIVNPIGFQVIEEAVFDENSEEEVLKRAINITSARLKLIRKNVTLKLKGYHIMWLLRDQITRIATTGITGFDSPVLNQSLVESSYTYQTLLAIIKFNENRFQSKALLNKFEDAIKSAQKALNHDFDTFDRFSFIKNHTNNQLKILLEIQKDWKVKYPFEMALSNNMSTLFSDKTLNINYFSDHLSDTTKLAEKIVFGKQLFNDTSLSKKYDMACATCHVKELAFTDGRKKFNKNQTRNSPTLTYAAYQRSFFMDARAGSLEGQVIGVVKNHNEFNMSMDSVVQRVFKNKNYKNSLATLYGNKRIDFNIRHAIASYIRTLNTFNSKFDKNIRNEKQTLTSDEKKGFNLFMGKALCASCHFPPLFNGTVPPNYKDTELEFIGVPESTDTINPKISSDLGRYNLYKTAERKHFFKTPTVRNIGKTAPYMHNGVYKTLDEVMDFYNKGGGAGLGFESEYQTLPFDSLSLSKKEISQVIDFMKTLTDQ